MPDLNLIKVEGQSSFRASHCSVVFDQPMSVPRGQQIPASSIGPPCAGQTCQQTG